MKNHSTLVSLFALSGALVFAAGCHPHGDPVTCTTGTLTIQNNAVEPVDVTITDANGKVLNPIAVPPGNGQVQEPVTAGSISVLAVGTKSFGYYLSTQVTVSCDVTNLVVVPNLNQKSVTVTFDGDGLGTVLSQPAGLGCNGDCVGAFPQGTDVVLTANPAANSIFIGWGGACTGSATQCHIANISDATSVVATFAVSTPGYPAAHTTLPQVGNHGGPILTAPVLTAITFPGDALVDKIESFTAQVGTSSWWTAAASEYGIGAATATAPVRMSQSPAASITDNDIQNFLIAQLDGANPPLGVPAQDALYILYYPSNVTVTAFGVQSCSYFAGYHSEVLLPKSNRKISYAVINRCTSVTSLIDFITETASHEIIEASTDPLPMTNSALWGMDQAHQIWETYSYGSEVGDMCQNHTDSYYTPSDLGFSVQASWSNAAAAFGRNPCQPNSAIYFNSAPVVNDAVHYSDGGTNTVSGGVLLGVGQSKAIDVQLFSDGPTNGPWTVSAAQWGGNTGNLSFSWDRTSGQNGDVLHLTVTVNSTDANFNAEIFEIRSTLNGVTRTWPVVVSATGTAGALSSLKGLPMARLPHEALPVLRAPVAKVH